MQITRSSRARPQASIVSIHAGRPTPQLFKCAMAAPRQGPRSRQIARAAGRDAGMGVGDVWPLPGQQPPEGVDGRPEHVGLTGEEVEADVGDAGAPQPLPLRRPVAAAA